MRKNLFLTLALLLASFVGATAQKQNWSVTLSMDEGLPGETVELDGGKVKYFKSGVIRADEEITSLRFTCAGNSTSHKPNGNNYRLMLSELNVYTMDMQELSYTVTSNADHNALSSGNFDGQGLKALYDGKYNNHFTSMYDEKGAVEDYHYLELTFEKPVQRFILEWAGKQGSGEVPSTVVLSKGGVAAEPYTDRVANFLDEKIDNVEDLVAAEYITIRGNASETFDLYNHTEKKIAVGGKKQGDNNWYGQEWADKELRDLPGSGPMYVHSGDAYAKEPSLEFFAKIIPAEETDDEGNDLYYIYFPMQKTYLSGDLVANAFGTDAQNGWQYAVADIEKAAMVKLTEAEDGDFEISYAASRDDADFEIHVGQDPRTGAMKSFSLARKNDLLKDGYCKGFGIKCAFNWSFYAVEYAAPTWIGEYQLSTLHRTAKDLLDVVAEEKAAEKYVAKLEASIAELENAVENCVNLSEEEIDAILAEQKEVIGEFVVFTAGEELGQNGMASQWQNYKNQSSNVAEIGKYLMSAFNQYVQPDINMLNEIYALQEYVDAVPYAKNLVEYFENKQAHIDAFLASKVAEATLPLVYTTAEGENALGTKKEGFYVWEQDVVLTAAVTGIRITFLESDKGGANVGEWEKYPVVALSELEIYNGDTKLQLTANCLSTNSQETSEGPIENLVEGKTSLDEGATAGDKNFWHSIWGNGTMDPKGYVYLDVKFSEDEAVSLSSFKIKTIGRKQGSPSLNPKTVAIGVYGEVYEAPEEEVTVENLFGVKIGAKVTDAADLVDGGLYAIQGNLFTQLPEDAWKPRFYAGIAPYSDSLYVAEDTPTVFMLKKSGDDTWNILNLANAKYWNAEAEDAVEAFYSEKAGNVKFAKSNNIQDAWIIYSELAKEELKAAKYSYTDTITNVTVNIEEEILLDKQVYMDWEGGLASRPCYSIQPGVLQEDFEAQLKTLGEAVYDSLVLNTSAGDALHFNKTNGEGEWSIYKVEMNDPYYVYLKSYLAEVEKLNIVTGNNPGCVLLDEEDAADYEDAIAAARVAVNDEIKENAKNITETLVAATENIAKLDHVGFDPMRVYQIQSANPSFEECTWLTRSIYASVGASKQILKWGVTPEDFENNTRYLFRVIPIDEEVNAQYTLGVSADQLGKVYIVKMLQKNLYFAKFENGAPAERVEEKRFFTISDLPQVYRIENHENGQDPCQFAIINNKDNLKLHARGHASGWGRGNHILDWDAAENSASSWRFIDMGEVDPTNVENVVVEGDEVVAVSYFTPAGMAIAEPVKGINIVVTVYANGVVEAKKILVK